jgi:hypothetical protein
LNEEVNACFHLVYFTPNWWVILFLLLLFGVPYGRYFLRVKNIPDWPIVSATVRKTEVLPGLPREYVPSMAITVARIPQLVPYHCRALYVFLVDGALYEGWFALVAKSQTEAVGFAETLKGQSILIRYDPRKPADSTVEGQKVLERKIYQDTNLLNPKVW